MVHERAIDDRPQFLIEKNMLFYMLHLTHFSHHVQLLKLHKKLVEIAQETGVETNPRNVRRILQTCDNIIRRKLKPALTTRHKELISVLQNGTYIGKRNGSELYSQTKRDST